MEVELPNGVIAEFPDDMPHDQIQSVISSHLGSRQTQKEAESSAFDSIKKTKPGMPEFLIKALMPIASYQARHKTEDDGRGTGTGAFLRSAIRTPLEGANNFASLIGLPVDNDSEWPDLIKESESDKGHPFAEIGGSLAGFLPMGIGSVNALRAIPAWANIVEKSAPSLLRRAPVLAGEGAALGGVFSPDGDRGMGALVGAGLGGASSVLPNVINSLGALKNRFSSLRNLDRLKEEGSITSKQYDAAVAEHDAIEALSKEQGLGTNPNEMEANLPLMQGESSALESEINSIPKQDLSNRLPSPSGEELSQNAESLLADSASKVAQQEENLSRMLGKGNAHRKRVAEKLNPLIEKKQSEIGKGYDSYIEGLKDKQVTLSNNRDIKQITHDIQELLKKGDVTSPELTKLADEMLDAGKSNVMPADKFVSAYRSLRSMAQKTRSSAYGKSQQEFDRLIQSAESMDSDVLRMEELINKGLGKENLKELNDLNKRYATEIAPLFKNKFFQHMRANSKAPKNMIEQLTNEPYVKSTNPNKVTGSKILNDLIKEDPELLHNVIGERFASNPKDIDLWDESVEHFLKNMPRLKEEINKYSQLKNEHSSNQKNLENAKQKSDSLKSDANRVEKGFNEDVKKQKIRTEKQEQLKKINEKIENTKRNIPELRQKAKNKNITLQRKMELENKIKSAEDDIKKLKKQAWIIGAELFSLSAAGIGLSRR